jgi:transposase
MGTRKRGARKYSQRSTRVYNTLPTNVNRGEFNRYIKPHLSRGSRGKKPRLSLFMIFNHVLYVLHTGIQWRSLPTRGAHWSSVYRQHNRWSKDGSYKKIFEHSLEYLVKEKKLDLSALHGDGSNVVAKKGELASAIRDTNIRGAKKPWISRIM